MGAGQWFVFPATVNAAPFTIDMEGIAPNLGGTDENSSTRVFGDYQVFITHGHFRDGLNTDSARAYNATDYLLNDNASGIVVSRVDGAPFPLVSFDAAEYLAFADFSGFPPGEEIDVIGDLSGGGMISTLFTMDQNPTDGPGGVTDFETFVLGAGWSSLDSVTILNDTPGFFGGIMAWDNIVVSVDSAAIPEPSTLALWSLGAVGLFGLGWRRRKRVA